MDFLKIFTNGVTTSKVISIPIAVVGEKVKFFESVVTGISLF